MGVPLDEAMRRLEASLGLLEASVARRLANERNKVDLETELQIMQDDRARLAVELDGAVDRLGKFEAASQDVERRVDRAIASIEEVLAHAGERPEGMRGEGD